MTLEDGVLISFATELLMLAELGATFDIGCVRDDVVCEGSTTILILEGGVLLLGSVTVGRIGSEGPGVALVDNSVAAVVVVVVAPDESGSMQREVLGNKDTG